MKRIHPHTLVGTHTCPRGCVPDYTGIKSTPHEAEKAHYEALVQWEEELCADTTDDVQAVYLKFMETEPYDDGNAKGFITTSSFLVLPLN